MMSQSDQSYYDNPMVTRMKANDEGIESRQRNQKTMTTQVDLLRSTKAKNICSSLIFINDLMLEMEPLIQSKHVFS